MCGCEGLSVAARLCCSGVWEVISQEEWVLHRGSGTMKRAKPLMRRNMLHGCALKQLSFSTLLSIINGQVQVGGVRLRRHTSVQAVRELVWLSKCSNAGVHQSIYHAASTHPPSVKSLRMCVCPPAAPLSNF